MSFEEIEHTADRAFRVQGRNFAELLENAARAMSSLDRLGPGATPSVIRAIEAEGIDRETLLVNWKAFEFCQHHLSCQQLIANDALYSGGSRILADHSCQQIGLRTRVIDELGLVILLQDQQHTDKNQGHQNGVYCQHANQHAPGVAGKKMLSPSRSAHDLPMMRIPGVLIAVSYSMKVMVDLSFCSAASRSARF